MITRVVLDLDGSDEKATMQLLKRLLKILGRAYGIRCKGITAAPSER